MVEADDSLFGTDYSSTGELTSNGDIGLVTGIENAKQNIRNWLLTDKGFYPEIDTEYGSEIRLSLGDDFIDKNIDAVIVHIQNALYANPRVLNILEINPYITVNDELIIQLSLELVNNTITNLNLNIIEV